MQNEGEIEINITDKEGYGLILDNSGIEFLNQGLLKMDSIGFSGIWFNVDNTPFIHDMGARIEITNMLNTMYEAISMNYPNCHF